MNAGSWLQMPFEEIERLKAVAEDQAHRNDLNQRRVFLLLSALRKANDRLNAVGAVPEPEPALDADSIKSKAAV